MTEFITTATTLVAPRYVKLGLTARDQRSAILEVADLLTSHEATLDFAVFRRDLLAREAAGSTYLAGGTALPHARTAAVSEILVAAGRSEEGVTFTDAPGPVHLIFVVATPKNQITGYLATVGALARLLRNDKRRQELRACSTAAEFARLLPSS